VNKELQYQFKNEALFIQALTHKSHFNEQGRQGPGDNEKLEFLGDAVLDLVLSEYLMELFPQDDEGSLSKKRASLVNESLLSNLALNLGISQKILLGKGEIASGGAEKPRLLASAFEAILGAIYLDAGFSQARQVIREFFSTVIAEMDPSNDFSNDFKTRFQEIVQAEKKPTPQYEVTNETGPSHSPVFEVSVLVQGEVWGQATGKNKKQAEQEAAKVALAHWMEKASGDSNKSQKVGE
jgi:ribonuclease-3